ncbi:hypothetical protein GCM10010978_32830 [Compostibacillus humi]|uniref:Uncharacterized protein n=1 Tax=Compostibacillus humi TaxID=1245525 RepID=A0A8J2XHZ2_9BACI|nr:hypothetical protein GCM10010978_32830 [Compostibacillus humi]
MSTMTLYADRDSVIHNHVSPLTKVLYVVVSIAITYIYPDLLFVLLVTLFSGLMLTLGKLSWLLTIPV